MPAPAVKNADNTMEAIVLGGNAPRAKEQAA
jgi:hypothetical protein